MFFCKIGTTGQYFIAKLAQKYLLLGTNKNRSSKFRYFMSGLRHANTNNTGGFIYSRSLPKFQGFFMRAVVSEFRRSGLEEAFFKDVSTLLCVFKKVIWFQIA